MSGLSGALARRRIAGVVPPPPVGGDYSGARYLPRYPLPSGVTYDPVIGWTVGTPFSVSRLESGNTVTATEQGSLAANRAHLQTLVTNTGTDAATIIVPPSVHGWGDEILIPGVARVGVGLTIRSASIPRPEGKRVQAGDTGMAQFRLHRNNPWGTANLPGGNPQFRQVFRIGHGATKVRFVGLDIGIDPTMTAAEHGPVTGAPPLAQTGLIGNEINGTLVYPQTIIIDGCRIWGVPGKANHRGVFLNGAQIAVINSDLRHWHYSSQDSQCMLATEGGAGHVFENNYAAAAFGENWMYGGGEGLYDGSGNPILARIPTDIVVRRNRFDFPSTYLSAGYLHKNLFEVKGGRGGVFERNLCTGYRLDNGIWQGQYWALVFRYSTMAGFRWLARLNRVANSHGFSLTDGVEEMEYLHNLFDTTGVPKLDYVNFVLSVGGADTGFGSTRFPDGFTFRGNTTAQGARLDEELQSWMLSEVTQRLGWRVEDNVVVQTNAPSSFAHAMGYLGRSGNFQHAKLVWEETPRTGSTWAGNVVSGIRPDRADRAIPGDIVVESQAALGLNASFRPQAGSPALGKGCDIDLLDAALDGVETGL